MTPGPTTLHRILSAADWAEAQAAGVYHGSQLDRTDGFIHLSTPDQLAETARVHFAGAVDHVVLSIDRAALDGSLRWEPSREGALFPHLYGPLPTAAVTQAVPLEMAVAR